MDISADLFECFISFLIKETPGGTVKNEIIPNQELAEELHKSIIRKLKKKKYTYLLTFYRQYFERTSSIYCNG